MEKGVKLIIIVLVVLGMLAVPAISAEEKFCAHKPLKPSRWSKCVDDKQTRVVYMCNTSTGSYDGIIQARDCMYYSGYSAIPTQWLLVGTVLLLIASSGVILIHRRTRQTVPQVPNIAEQQRPDGYQQV